MINYAHSSSLSFFVFYLSCSQSKTEKPKSVPIHGSARGLRLNTLSAEVGPEVLHSVKASSLKQAALVNSWGCLPVPQENGPGILWLLTSRY